MHKNRPFSSEIKTLFYPPPHFSASFAPALQAKQLQQSKFSRQYSIELLEPRSSHRRCSLEKDVLR